MVIATIASEERFDMGFNEDFLIENDSFLCTIFLGCSNLTSFFEYRNHVSICEKT